MTRATYEATEQFNDAAITEDRAIGTGRTLTLQKKRVTAVVQVGDTLGSVRWRGWGGSTYNEAAKIVATVDGTPGASDMPTRLSLHTTADGASTATERTRWNNAGVLMHSFSVDFNWTLPTLPTGTVTQAVGSGLLVGETAASAGTAPVLAFVKQRGTGTVVNGDTAGSVHFDAHNGTNVQRGAVIRAVVNGTPSSTSMPMNLAFATTPAGSNTARDVLELQSTGDIVTKAAGRYINDGLGAQDTRILLYGGSGTSKAVSFSFSNAFDAQGTLSLQRRTTSDGFEANIFGINLSTNSAWMGSGTIPAANPMSFTGQFFLSSGYQMHQNWASSDGNGAAQLFTKIRGASIVQSGDVVGDLRYRAFDGTNYQDAALIRVTVGDTPGTNDMPGEIQFFVTPDGSTTLTRRATLTQGGEFLLNTNTPFGNSVALGVNANIDTLGLHVRGGLFDANITGLGQGSYVTWNRHGGGGAMEFVNHKGGGAGGWYFTNTDGTTFTDYLTIDSNGCLNFLLASSYANFGSTTRQMINLWGGVANSAYGIGVQASTQYYRTNDSFAWFKNGTHSNTQFDPGAGGTLLATLNGNGEWRGANYGSPLANKGVVGASTTLDWRANAIQRFQTTSATNCTISFTAPTNPCNALMIKMVAPASGTTPTLTWPMHKGTALPTTITLAKTRMAHILYDGTDYVVLSLTPEY